jgi:DNA-binding MarR family transcriptional regulator
MGDKITTEMGTPAAVGSMALLTRLSRVVYQHATEAVLGMRLKQYMALNHLRDHPGSTQQALGEALHLDANNCVLLLNTLEVDGLAERRRDPSDRRRHLVSLTPRGQVALELADRALESVEETVLAALTAQERTTLRGLLSRALENGRQALRQPEPVASQS